MGRDRWCQALRTVAGHWRLSEPDGSRDRGLSRLRDIICPAFEQDHSAAGQGGKQGNRAIRGMQAKG